MPNISLSAQLAADTVQTTARHTTACILSAGKDTKGKDKFEHGKTHGNPMCGNSDQWIPAVKSCAPVASEPLVS